MSQPGARIVALDLIRGVAVLGILAVNVLSFADAPSASYSPDLPAPGPPADHIGYFVTLVLFEGKMRALFSLLFGASLLLFIERAEAQERDGEGLQLRRLGWLALFGYLHYLLLWRGDILFLYAVAGFAAWFARHWSPRRLVLTGLLVLAVWQGFGNWMWREARNIEAAELSGNATPAQSDRYRTIIADYRKADAEHLEVVAQPWVGLAKHQLIEEPFYPLRLVLFALGETLGYVLIGMALLRSGLFGGEWSRRRVQWLAWGGIGIGLAASLDFAVGRQASHYPEIAMRYSLSYGVWPIHLAMALGYAAALVLLTPRLLRTSPGRWLVAAGRMAFSNYLGTSLVMSALFYGWGLGLAGRHGHAELWLFVLLGWALMLAWSAPWLKRFRQGPLEWLWRSLTEWRRLPFRR